MNEKNLLKCFNKEKLAEFIQKWIEEFCLNEEIIEDKEQLKRKAEEYAKRKANQYIYSNYEFIPFE